MRSESWAKLAAVVFIAATTGFSVSPHAGNEPLAASGEAIYGHFSRDSRYHFFSTPDGTVTKRDVADNKLAKTVRAGEKTRNIAMSSDGNWLLVANEKPRTLVVLKSGGLVTFKVIKLEDTKGNPFTVDAAYNSASRQAFIVTMKDSDEVWELSYDPEAPPVYGNFVHTYRAGQEEGIVVEEQPFARRRLKLKVILSDVFLDPYGADIVGVPRGQTDGVVYNLDARRKVADLKLGGVPHFGAGITWESDGRQLMAVPHLDQSLVSIVDMSSWEIVEQLRVKGPGYFPVVQMHSPVVSFVVLTGPEKGQRQLFDKRGLKFLKSPSGEYEGVPVFRIETRMLEGRILHSPQPTP